MVLERLDISKQHQEQEFQRAVENDKLYHNYIDETTHPYISNISLPWPYIIVESYLGKCIQVLAASLPYCRVVEEDDDSRPKAKKVERDANMVLYRQKWPIFAYNAYKQGFKYGTGFVLEKPWGQINGIEMPIFTLMPYFNTYYNWNTTDFTDEDAYVIYESYVPLRSYAQYKNNPNYKNLNNIKVHTGRVKNEYQDEIDSARDKPEIRVDNYSKLVKQYLYVDHEYLFIITNEDNVIRNGKNFMGGHIPVKAVRPIPVEDQFPGMSILEEGKGLFAEINENRNQYNDAVWLMLNPQWIMDNQAGVKKSTIIARPGGILFADDINGVKPMPMDWNILSQSLLRGNVIEKDLQNYSNAFPQMRGQPGNTQGTATGDMIMRSAGELRSDTYNLLLSMMSIEDMTQDIVRFKRMFMTEESEFYYWPESQTRKATPDDYKGNFTFKAIAGYKMAREIERKQMIEAMTVIFGNQAFLPLVLPKANEWLERLIDYFDLRSPEQLYITDEETRMNAMMQQLQMMTGQGGNGNPLQIGNQGNLALGEREMRMPETTPNPMTMQLLGR